MFSRVKLGRCVGYCTFCLHHFYVVCEKVWFYLTQQTTSQEVENINLLGATLNMMIEISNNRLMRHYVSNKFKNILP